MFTRTAQIRASRPGSERGAAMVEMVGIMFVVSVLMVGVAGRVTSTGGGSIPSTVMWGICSAFSKAPGFEGLQCGEDPAKAEEAKPSEPSKNSEEEPDRAGDLKVPCVKTQTNRSDKVHVVVNGVRVGEGGSDEIKVNADGTATVTLSQGVEAGVEGGVESGSLKANGHAVVTGELKHVYEFDNEADARAFLESRRNGLNRTIDAVIPGAQTVKEGGTRFFGWLQSGYDHMPWVSDADRDKHAKDRENNTSDGISIAVGGKASGSAGAELSDRVKGSVDAEIAIKGEATAYYEAGKGSSFTGSIEGKVSASLTAKLGDKGTLGGFFSASGGAQASGKASYRVVFDGNGQPTRLVLTTERSLSAQGGVSVDPSKTEKYGPQASKGGLTVDSWTLDLTDPANRAAFDATFDVATVSSGDHSAGVAIPKLVPTPDQINAWQTLGERLDSDSYEATYHYDLDDGKLSGKDKDYGATAGAYGGGVDLTSSTRTLTSATARDNRTGGKEVPLSTCND